MKILLKTFAQELSSLIPVLDSLGDTGERKMAFAPRSLLIISALIASSFALIGCSEAENSQAEPAATTTLSSTPNSTQQADSPELQKQPQSSQPNQPIQHSPYDGDATGLAEIKLIDAQDDPRGWCVDLFSHRLNAQPIGGMQGHNCFMYFNIGSPTEDQGFDIERFQQTGQFALPYFDVCMTLYEPNTGSFVASDSCSDDPAQIFTMSETGHIQPKSSPDLCLTLGTNSVPGGARARPPNSGRPPENNDSIHIIRRLTFSSCSEELVDRQQWEFRFNEYTADETAEPHQFMYGKQ